ncbi:MAG: glyceraldehyde-3-phosphate dehydrogenase [Rhodocyclaceae bacterium]|nr:glyceraldehyde-3-phosphate dehydrogenase [Rhodocyclaceae bacterium]MBX3669927.1 glyceraldehyde-3-phosphate dehydrogenase [Rhodocyclaceae bacterium]
MTNEQADQLLQNFIQRQELAERMLPMIGRLYRNNGISLRIYGRPINNVTTVDILKTHRFARQYTGEELPIQESFKLVEAMESLELAPARLDLGRLTNKFLADKSGPSAKDFLRQELAPIVGHPEPLLKEPRDIVLYGFGRIGRLLARLLIERTGNGNKMRLRAIVVRKGKGNDLEKRAALLRRDSVHGPFNGSITIDTEHSAIIANGNFIKVIYGEGPDKIDYPAYGIKNAIVIDNTGSWRDEAGLSLHLKSAGVARVLLTAPGKGALKNVVYGINNGDITDDDKILSAASCTTNAIVPVLKAVYDKYGIEHGHVETVHSYTNDQNLIDNYHKAERRGRSAPLNMVITETGAAKAVAKALPELAGKLTGNAIRVPTPNVSMAILNLTLEQPTSKEEINTYLRDCALSPELQEQIDFIASTEIVSSDLVGSRHAGVVDSQATIANGRNVVLYVWYDNEFGYSCQVVRIAQQMAGIQFASFPA